MSCSRVLFASLIAMCAIRPAIAQMSTQAASAGSTPDWTVTAGEDAHGLRLYREQPDSVLEARARTWLASLQKTAVTGIQLDPMGVLYVRAGQDALAKQQFAARLATPGLPLDDRAYTLFLAMTTFGAQPRDTSRLRVALDYLAQLDAMPASVVRIQYAAHTSLAGMYYFVGDAAGVITNTKMAFTLMARMPFDVRRLPSDAFLQLADVLSGQPNGRAQIDSVAQVVLSLFKAPPEFVARDSSYYWSGYMAGEEFKRTLKLTDFLGRPASAVTAHYWWNTTPPVTPSPIDPAATTKSLDDGKIRVIELGSFTCGWCFVALRELDRYRKSSMPSNVDIIYLTTGLGVWGAEACTPSQEAAHLKHFYLEQHQIGVPIALWVGSQKADINGGTQPQANPSWEIYGIGGGPAFIITDGRGIVRHVSSGYSRGLPVQFRALQFLIAEAAHTHN